MAEQPVALHRPPTPEEIFALSEREGRQRLERSLPAQMSTGFTAGFNVVFAIVALGITQHLVAQHFGPEAGELAGAVAFGVGLTFLVVGRSELFTENFLDPLAARAAGVDRFWRKLSRLWGLSLAFNLIGGVLLVTVLSTDGALPEGAPGALVEVAERIADRGPWADFTNAIAGGALVTLLTWLVLSAGSATGRFLVAWAVGWLLALGPLNHVVVTVLHLYFGLRYDATLTLTDLAEVGAIATLGNLVGGILFVTLLRAGQAVR